MDMKTIGITLVVLCVFFFLFSEFEKRATFRKLHNLLARGEYGEYLSLLDSFLIKYLYPKYNRLYMKLNGYLFMEDHDEASRLFEQMLSMHVTKKQRKDLVMKAFNYYVERMDKDHSSTLLAEIDTWEEEAQKVEAHRIYDIFILKKYNYIEEMEARLNDVSGFDLGALEYLLSVQYENKGDARDFNEYYELRQVCPDDAEEATGIEAICFLPSEACTLPIMKERIQYAARSFLVAMDRETGKMVGFINALCTDEESLRDELFTDISLHNPNGKNVMICSVAVLPQYQGRGIAREMVRELLLEQRKLGKKCAILTCVPGKVKMYKKFGFMDRGESQSTWGGEKWHEMWCTLNS